LYVLTALKTFYKPSIASRTLSILEALNDNMETSQKALAEQTMMSGAMINQYIRSLQHKGWLSMEADNGKKYAYRLTRLGLEERSRLRAEYWFEVAGLYSGIKDSLLSRLQAIEPHPQSLAIFGASELSELLIAVLRDSGSYHVAALIDQDAAKQGGIQQGLTVSAPEVLRYVSVQAVINASLVENSDVVRTLPALAGSSQPQIMTL
jgi:DNA-binding MarR family transcriptional regulator